MSEVFRVEKNRDYTTMANFHLRDRNLSLKAKGLLSLMLSLPDDWEYSVVGFAQICKDGVSCIRATLKELQENHYLTLEQSRDENGRMSRNEYTIYEKPLTDLPLTEKPCAENPQAVNPYAENLTQLSNKQSSTEIQNTDLLSINQSYPDGIEAIDAYKQVIYDNIEYDILSAQYDREQLDEIIEIMLECICSNADTIRIAQDDVPQELVKSRMLKINSEHIEYIFGCLKSNTTKVRNIKAYLKAVIYNAPVTISNYYSAEVNHDLYGG
ncbi:MAG: helix-turn-helix domain-containing protein [Ruminococcus sp.]|jgi:hypothetical protein|nr:helix-turn-helix domain-containing protein [Ruminococcus sp.]